MVVYESLQKVNRPNEENKSFFTYGRRVQTYWDQKVNKPVHSYDMRLFSSIKSIVEFIGVFTKSLSDGNMKSYVVYVLSFTVHELPVINYFNC